MSHTTDRALVGFKGWARSRRNRGLKVVVSVLLALAAQSGAEERGAGPDLKVALVGIENGYACAWQPGLPLADVDSRVTALASFDDGTGPALYAGGLLTTAGDTTANHIARWDGTSWSALSGPSGNGVDHFVAALTVYDDGAGPALYAGGSFTTAGGVTVNRVARWNGTAWSALSGPSGTGVDDDVRALAVFDDGSGPALYVGGDFTTAGGVTVNHVARWDGSAWSALSGPAATGVDDLVSALAVAGSSPALYAGGAFTTAGGITANYVARWDGSAWSALDGPYGTGMNNSVSALVGFDDGSGPVLYAGGAFLTSGGVLTKCIARWDGSGWSDLSGPSGTGVGVDYSEVTSLVVFDDGTGSALYAGGWFEIAGGVSVNNVARWDGSVWSDLSGPSGTGVNIGVYALGTFDDGSGPGLFAGGDFTTAGGLPSSYIAQWHCVGPIFVDGFDSGGTGLWSHTVP